MKDPKCIWVWVGVAVVVVAVALIWKPTVEKPLVASVPTPVYASQGQLVPQFPKGLIIDSKAAMSGSYSINYSSSTNQYAAEYYSSSTVTSLYNQYQTYLPRNSWTVIGSITTRPSYDVIWASQGNDQLQVIIGTQKKGSQVTVTYTEK